MFTTEANNLSPMVFKPNQSPADHAATLSRDIGVAFWRALKSQCHPRMIFALFLPVMVTMVLGIVLLWFGWTPLTDWLSLQLTDSAVPGAIEPLISTTVFLALKAWLIPIAAFIILMPLVGIVGLAVAAIWVMPMVLGHVGRRNYPDVTPEGRHAVVLSVWNAIWVSVLFLLGWLITLPLWLIPPLGLVMSLFWWSFAFSRMMRVDALVDHASPLERKVLWRERNGGFWLLGLACAVLNLFPPAWVFLPVFSGLVFSHYGFEALRQLRQAPEPPLDSAMTREAISIR